jgi:hypothetical protein
MRLIAIIQKIMVTIKIQARWSTSTLVMAGRVSIRMMATRWVSGKRISAIYWRATGKRVNGKNVPENNAMGVMNRNEG